MSNEQNKKMYVIAAVKVIDGEEVLVYMYTNGSTTQSWGSKAHIADTFSSKERAEERLPNTRKQAADMLVAKLTYEIHRKHVPNPEDIQVYIRTYTDKPVS